MTTMTASAPRWSTASSRGATRSAGARLSRSTPCSESAGRGAAVRLTRRGRMLAVLTLLLALVVIGMTVGRVSGQASTGRSPAGTTTLTVQPGESLWTVADRIDPHQDPRLVVAALEAANGLAGPQLIVGQQLVIPHIG